MTERSVKVSYYIISSLYTLSASFIWGINTLFLMDAGLDIFQVFVANAVFTAGMTLFEIPTGVFADVKGRRFSFLVSTIVLLIGTLGYLISSVFSLGLIAFCLFSAILGLGFTFYSGAVEAWVVDELHAVGYQGPLDTIFSKGASISGATMILGTIAGGALGTVHLNLPYIARAAALGLLFFYALSFMKETGFSPLGNKDPFRVHVRRIARESVEYGWRRGSLRFFMILSLFQSAFMMWGFYASQPYFLDLLGRPEAVWISGLIAACVALAQIGGNSLVGPIMKRVPKRTTVLFAAGGAAAVCTMGISFVHSFMGAFIFFLSLMACLGLFAPIKQGYMHELIPSEKRATVLSFDSLIGNAGGMIGQPGLGFIAKNYSIGTGYFMGSLLLFCTLPFIGRIRMFQEKADLTTSD